ncbi:hypothetical protein GOB02_21635 [Sinorhizobium meliloti]|nr:hypothetical protein [Sinorhizobium meliloti]
MDQAKTLSDRAHIRVSLNEDKTIQRELMHGEYKIANVSKADVIEMIMNFTSSLRYDGK